MENDYRYLLKVGFFDDGEDEVLDIDFDAAIEEFTNTGSFNCEICKKNIYKQQVVLKDTKRRSIAKLLIFIWT